MNIDEVEDKVGFKGERVVTATDRSITEQRVIPAELENQEFRGATVSL